MAKLLQHAGTMDAAQLAHVLFSLDHAADEQRALASLPAAAQLAVFPLFHQRLADAGVSLSPHTGSIVLGTPRGRREEPAGEELPAAGEEQEESAGAPAPELRLSQALERTLSRHSPPPRHPWAGGPDEPLVSSSSSGRFRGSVRVAPDRVTTLRLSHVYWNMCNLAVLDVSGARIGAFLPPAVTGHMVQLVTVNCSGCGLRALPEDIGQLQQLQELNVSDNSLAALPLQVGKLVRLRVLAFARNRISELPAVVVAGLASLEILWASGNALRRLPETALAHLPRLRDVDVSCNQLLSFPRLLCDSCPSLLSLNVSLNDPCLTDDDAPLRPRLSTSRRIVIGLARA